MSQLIELCEQYCIDNPKAQIEYKAVSTSITNSQGFVKVWESALSKLGYEVTRTNGSLTHYSHTTLPNIYLVHFVDKNLPQNSFAKLHIEKGKYVKRTVERTPHADGSTKVLEAILKA